MSLGDCRGGRALLTCLSELKRIAKGWLRAEMDLQNVCLVNPGFLKIFLWKLEVRGVAQSDGGPREVVCLRLINNEDRPHHMKPHLMLLRIVCEKHKA